MKMSHATRRARNRPKQQPSTPAPTEKSSTQDIRVDTNSAQHPIENKKKQQTVEVMSQQSQDSSVISLEKT